MRENQAKSIYIMMISVAFIDGALRITNIPTFYLWKDYLGLSPGVNCLLRYITKLPWCVKPLFAYFSDRHYLWGYRTKIYFIITGIIEAICLVLLGIPTKNTFVVTLLIFVDQAMIAFRDSLAEGLMVVLSRKEDAQNKVDGSNTKESSSKAYVSIIFVLRFVGTLGSSFIAGILLEKFTPHQVLVICVIFPIVTTLQAIFYFDEEKVENTVEIASKFKGFSMQEILEFIDRKKLTSFIFFITILLLWPNTISGIRYFLIDELNFTTYDVGMIFTLSSLGYIIYMYFMNTFFNNYTLKNFYMSIIYMMIFNVFIRNLQMTPELYSLAFLFGTVDQTINNLFYDLPSIPLLAIVCRNCPESKEATYYAFFVSLSNFFCSLANFTGFLFLDVMDVSSSNFNNVMPVNYMCLIWAIMLWNVSFYLKFPDGKRAIAPAEKRGEKSLYRWRTSKKMKDEYTSEISEGPEN